MVSENNRYWLARSGEAYSEQQVGRTGSGNATYRLQEAWLADLFSREAEKRGRPLKILEFGCGFGRLARCFHNHPSAIYHGYDFSRSMAEPLFNDPPSGLAPIASRVRIAPTVGAAFAGEQFDLIFTVSVLIHNAPEHAADLLRQMGELLVPMDSCV